MRATVAVFAVFLVLLLGVVGGGYTYVHNDLVQGRRAGQPAVDISIPAGTSTSGIADILASKGLIGSPLLFQLYVKYRGYNLQAGEYHVEAGLSAEQVALLLQHNSTDTTQVRITIPEGLTARQVGALAESKHLFSADAYVNEVTHGTFSEAFLADRPAGADLQGFLFPDTYFVRPNTTAHELIDLQLRHFGERITPEMRARAAAQKVTFHQALVLASIIEREARFQADRAPIAGVFYNRLARGMPLQADATLLFAKGVTSGSVTEADKQSSSPYNTYGHTGLPPGPICNPGQAAIEAALNPKASDYLYYITDHDGHAHFARTFAEHEQLIQQYGVR
jgi:UPF0755 protein